MGDVTRAEVSRIKHKISANSHRQKRGEAIFLACFLCLISFFLGYVIGALNPRKFQSSIYGWDKKVHASHTPAKQVGRSKLAKKVEAFGDRAVGR